MTSVVLSKTLLDDNIKFYGNHSHSIKKNEDVIPKSKVVTSRIVLLNELWYGEASKFGVQNNQMKLLIHSFISDC